MSGHDDFFFTLSAATGCAEEYMLFIESSCRQAVYVLNHPNSVAPRVDRVAEWSGALVPSPASSGLRVQFPSPLGRATLPSTGASVTAL